MNSILFLFLVWFSSLEASRASELVEFVKNGEKVENSRLIKNGYFYAISGDPNTKLGFDLAYPVSKRVRFNYKQTMFWLLGKESKPFNDINFQPSFDYTTQFDSLELQLIAYEHNSNGKAGFVSRSYDRSSISLSKRIRINTSTLQFGLAIWGLYRVDIETPDLREYLGDGKVFARFNIPNSSKNQLNQFDLEIEIAPGGEYRDLFKRGFQKVTTTYLLGDYRLPLRVMLQLYNGYMESLLRYNKRESSFRIGLAI